MMRDSSVRPWALRRPVRIQLRSDGDFRPSSDAWPIHSAYRGQMVNPTRTEALARGERCHAGDSTRREWSKLRSWSGAPLTRGCSSSSAEEAQWER
jgi:hypothetical protein